MIEALFALIPVALREPSVISIILIICSFCYLDRGQRMLIKEIIVIKTEHEDLKDNFVETKSSQTKDIAEINVSLKSLAGSQSDIKQDIRDMRNKALK